MTNKKETKKPEKAEEVSVRIVPKKARKELPKEGAKKAEKIARKSARQAVRKEKAPIRRWKRTAVAFLLATVVLAGLLVAVVVRDIVMAQKDKTNLPRIDIALKNVSLETINSNEKTIKYDGNQMTLTAGGTVTEFDNVQVKGRGNSTWSLEKRSYQVKLSAREDLLGLGKAKKWVLVANYLDASNLRNDIAFKLAEMLGEKYAIRGDFVELYVDDIYYGVYYMSHKVNIGKEEVNLKDNLGIVMELDNLHKDAGGYFTRDGNYVVAKDVVDEDGQKQAEEEFLAAYNQLERAARRKDWETVQRVADARSFAEYYLISEFTNNPDAYTSSFFMYKDGPDDKVHAGPVWDFDLAMGNQEWGWQYTSDFYNPTTLLTMKDYAKGGQFYDSKTGETVQREANAQISQMIFNLLEIPEFRELVETVWREKMLGHENELTQYIRGMAAYIRDAALRDEARWKQSGFDEDVEYLIDWVRQRYETLNREYGMVNDYGENR